MQLLVAVRPPRAVSPPLAAALFDVVLASRDYYAPSSSPRCFVHVQRRLCDFAQLQRELAQELPALAPFESDVAVAAAEFLAQQSARDCDDADDAAAALLRLLTRVRGASGDPLGRLAWQLERFLAALLAHRSPCVRNARALQRFVRGGDSEPTDRDTTAVPTTPEQVAHDRIPAGCAVEHAVHVDASAGAQLVLWRFVSEGDGVVFSARFVTETDGAGTGDSGTGAAERDANSADPYSADANSADPYSADAYSADPYQSLVETAAWEATESDELAFFRTPVDGEMAQYPTRLAFPAAARGGGLDLADTTRRCVAGRFVAHTSGELVLEWENADTSSVLSKALAYLVTVVPLPEAAPRDADAEREPVWLQALFGSSELVGVADVLRELEESEGDDDDSARPDGDARADRGDRSDSDACAAARIARLQEEVAFHSQRARELEDGVVQQLQEELRATKSELKQTQDELAISGEIYRASLETITQLEIDSKRSSAVLEHNLPPAGATEAAAGVVLPCVAESMSFDSPPASDRAKAPTVSAKEHQRVVDLCTTFQEQCLWRSIELTESEKRTLTLDAQLRDAVDAAANLHVELEARDKAISGLEADVKKLKAHKTILVHEVKKLQPYAHVNLAVLVQEAQEARMMQRSLQARLDTLDATASRSNDLGGAAATMSSSSLVTLGEEDGAGGGFVVIEPADHGSFEVVGSGEL
ncbi:hypothetical protein PybrP1_000384 [[Pythium] brassicae (nom. inval.)]|nr:hypothetical protein PybrP1_000384 [[Pythium] brassicae (nom. inval.)]